MGRLPWRNLAAIRRRLRSTAAPAVLANFAPDEPVRRQTGSFDDDPRDLLELFAHPGIIAAGQRRLSVVEPRIKSRRTASFLLNQGLFDKSQN